MNEKQQAVVFSIFLTSIVVKAEENWTPAQVEMLKRLIISTVKYIDYANVPTEEFEAFNADLKAYRYFVEMTNDEK